MLLYLNCKIACKLWSRCPAFVAGQSSDIFSQYCNYKTKRNKKNPGKMPGLTFIVN
jgi:hypothetical protein